MKVTATTKELNTEIKGEKERHFLEDVLAGLKQHPKKLESKYFYDRRGDELFQEIMEMPEYYLTRCEMDIFKTRLQRLHPTSRLNKLLLI